MPRLLRASVLAAAFLVVFGGSNAPLSAQQQLHSIEGRLVAGNRDLRNVRVKLVMRSGMRPVGETITRGDGKFVFSNLSQGDYLVEVEETPDFHSAQAVVEVRKKSFGPSESLGRNEKPEQQAGRTFYVSLHMVAKERRVLAGPPGTIAADVDLAVPDGARRLYQQALERRDAGDAKGCIDELKRAVAAHPDYYAARLELGRELRRAKKFDESRRALEPLREIAPKRAEPLLELGITLLGLDKRDEAAKVLTASLEREETSWAAHLYLGYALLDVDDEAAEPHFWRALKINEREAAEAHLALARLAHRYGYIKEAVEQLEAYLAVAPDAPDAADVKKLAERLRKQAEKK